MKLVPLRKLKSDPYEWKKASLPFLRMGKKRGNESKAIHLSQFPPQWASNSTSCFHRDRTTRCFWGYFRSESDALRLKKESANESFLLLPQLLSQWLDPCWISKCSTCRMSTVPTQSLPLWRLNNKDQYYIQNGWKLCKKRRLIPCRIAIQL